MPRHCRPLVCALGAWLCGVLASPRPAGAAAEFAFYHEAVMGTSLELRVRADDAEAAAGAEGRVLGEIDRLSASFSGHDPSSEFRRWQAAPRGPTRLSPELFEVLRACDSWREASGGAFDPRVEVLSQLWAGSARAGRLPTPEEQAVARALLRGPAWRLDPALGTAERLSEGPLSLDAIAKGFIIERACDAALEGGRGVRGLLLNVGGDLRACGEIDRPIAIVSPRADSETSEPIAHLEVRDRAVATSGRSQRGFAIGGRWYSHIFDPRSGLPASGVAGASVIAERSADADALATILNVLGPPEGLRLVAALPGVECLIVAEDGTLSRSPGWHRYERPRAAPRAPGPLAQAGKPEAKPGEGKKPGEDSARPWGDEFELVVDFEINRPDAQPGRYRRPFVAVWVEDKEGFPVRNLVLWLSQGGAGPYQWLPDLKRWYRDDEARRLVDKTDMVYSFARPTRPPGKYSVIWDGKDDHGKPLPRGAYTLFIEAAREHGTYQSIRKPLELADRPFAEGLKGNVEIRSASIGYRRKGPAR